MSSAGFTSVSVSLLFALSVTFFVFKHDFLTGLGPLELEHLIYARLFTYFGLRFMEFQVRHFALFSFFLSNSWLQVVLDVA